MDKKFDKVMEGILREILSGRNIQNKINEPRDVDHITAMPRLINKHAAHIRPINKVIGNETGVHSKNPTSKPVYSKNGVKPNKNKSQRPLSNKSPYSAHHDKFGTKRKLADRRNKLLKTMGESVDYRSSGEETDFANLGHYILYKVHKKTDTSDIVENDALYGDMANAFKIADSWKNKYEEDIVVTKIIIYNEPKNLSLIKVNNKNKFYYIGKIDLKGVDVYTSEYY